MWFLAKRSTRHKPKQVKGKTLCNVVLANILTNSLNLISLANSPFPLRSPCSHAAESALKAVLLNICGTVIMVCARILALSANGAILGAETNGPAGVSCPETFCFDSWTIRSSWTGLLSHGKSLIW